MKKINDTIMLGIAAGLTGNLLKNIWDQVSIKAGLSKTSYPTIAGNLFLTQKQSQTKLGRAMGWLTDAAIGAGLGVGYVSVLRLTGKDHAYTKGVGYGHGAWALFLGGTNKLKVTPTLPKDPKTLMSFYVGHTLYGLGLALIATTMGDQNLFVWKKAPASLQTTSLDEENEKHPAI